MRIRDRKPLLLLLCGFNAVMYLVVLPVQLAGVL